MIWNQLKSLVGGEKILKSFNVRRLENQFFIISHAESNDYVTIIKKLGTLDKNEQEVLNSIGFGLEGEN